MKIVDLENISWFPPLFLTRQQIPRKYQLDKNGIDQLNCISKNLKSGSLENFWAVSDKGNFLTKTFSEYHECCVLFESSVFRNKELQRRKKKNPTTGISNQKQPWQDVPNIEWKKLLDNTT